MNKKKQPYLDQEDILKNVGKKIEKYKKLNFLETHARYIGTAQILEMELKNF